MTGLPRHSLFTGLLVDVHMSEMTLLSNSSAPGSTQYNIRLPSRCELKMPDCLSTARCWDKVDCDWSKHSHSSPQQRLFVSRSCLTIINLTGCPKALSIAAICSSEGGFEDERHRLDMPFDYRCFTMKSIRLSTRPIPGFRRLHHPEP